MDGTKHEVLWRSSRYGGNSWPQSLTLSQTSPQVLHLARWAHFEFSGQVYIKKHQVYWRIPGAWPPRTTNGDTVWLGLTSGLPKKLWYHDATQTIVMARNSKVAHLAQSWICHNFVRANFSPYLFIEFFLPHRVRGKMVQEERRCGGRRVYPCLKIRSKSNLKPCLLELNVFEIAII